MPYTHLTPPRTGEKITAQDGSLQVPDHPILPFIEGDGIGPDIWRAAPNTSLTMPLRKPMAAGARSSGLRSSRATRPIRNSAKWLPQDTLDAIQDYRVAIKGPLTTPVGGGIRSLNVALRQQLDLYACVRPVQYFNGVPSPVKQPEAVDMIIFRENSEDIYAGIEFRDGSEEVERFKRLFRDAFPDHFAKIRFPDTTGIGIKPVSQEGTTRLVRAAIDYAIQQRKPSVTLVHKGNIMKFTEGGFRDWGYQTAKELYGAQDLDGGPWQVITLDDGHEIIIKDVIADAFLQQILTRPGRIWRHCYDEPQR